MKNIVIILFLGLTLFSGCKDYLDVVPEDDILSEDLIFEQKTTALKYLATCYKTLQEGYGDVYFDPSLCGGDELVAGEYLRDPSLTVFGVDTYVPAFKIAEGFQNASSPVLSYWGARNSNEFQKHSELYTPIRYCNTFIKRAEDVYNFTEDEKLQFIAEAKAIKAFYYFQLVKRYGPIVLVPDNIAVMEPVSTMIEEKRSTVDDCFNRIVELFDEAIPHLKSISAQSTLRYGYMNREAAYAYKAKALMYAASPLFNGNADYTNFMSDDSEPFFNPIYSEEKWISAEKAIDEAIEYCESTGRKLSKDGSHDNTVKINTIRDIQASVITEDLKSDEMIFTVFREKMASQNQLFLPRWHYSEHLFNNSARGCLTPSMRMVEMYYSENGVPIEYDKTWGYTNRYKIEEEQDPDYQGIIELNSPTVKLHIKREPRFYAHIATDKSYWLRNTTNVLMNPYQGGTHGNAYDRLYNSVPQNLTGYWLKKGLSPRTFTEGSTSLRLESDHPYMAMRMADLYLMKAEISNEVSGPSEDVYNAIDLVRERAGLEDVVSAWTSYAINPNMINTKEGMREIIQRERMIELAFEGHRFWDLRRWKKAHIYMNKPLKGWNVFNGINTESFYNNEEGPKEINGVKVSFLSPRDYFWPIRDEEVLVSDIKQNPGW